MRDHLLQYLSNKQLQPFPNGVSRVIWSEYVHFPELPVLVRKLESIHWGELLLQELLIKVYDVAAYCFVILKVIFHFECIKRTYSYTNQSQ
jgi:hypothetical protein